MKVLFIGGTGNISTSSSQLAVKRGIDLYLLNRGTQNLNIPGAKTLVGDRSNSNEMKRLLSDHSWDVVVNWIAFKPKDIERDFELFHNKTKHYIFLSSASAYQKPPAHPVITEATALKNPYWQYSRDKIACEQLLKTYYRKYNFPMSIVRPSLTYSTVIPVVLGGWKEYTIIDRIKKGKKVIVHGDGTSLWTITHADDFAKGFVSLLGQQRAIGQDFHITSDELLTWNQIYESVANAVGATANSIHIPSDFLGTFDDDLRGSLLGDKAHSVIFDNSKIKAFVPGFEATIPFKEGIKRTIDWFEAEPSRMHINPETNKLMDHIIAKYEQ